jgi:hypothetical protein
VEGGLEEEDVGEEEVYEVEEVEVGDGMYCCEKEEH